MKLADGREWNPDPDLSGTFDEDRRAANHPGPVLPDGDEPAPVEDVPPSR